MSEPEKLTPSASWLSMIKIGARAVSSLLRPSLQVPSLESVSSDLPRVVSPDTLREARVPKGQVKTTKWPVLHAGPTPHVDLATWNLKAFGLIESPKSWSWEQFHAEPTSLVAADMHCVTRWSRLDNLWEGVLVRDWVKSLVLRPEAKFVLIHAEQGFTTNLALEDFLGEDCLFAWSHDGNPLTADHGGPLRLVIPRLYAWKSAKWVRGIEFLDRNEPGFWEQNGYHNHGDPWTEERFW